MTITAFDEGLLAAKAGARADSNPFEAESARHASWQRGFDRWTTLAPSPPRRWGYKSGGHPLLQRVLTEHKSEFWRLLEDINKHKSLLHSISYDAAPEDAQTPHWNNGFFTGLDASVLITMLAERRPRLFLEVGSGNSTVFARHTISKLGLPTKITSIDPEPRRAIDSLCDHSYRQRLQDVDIKVFDALEEGDICFFDGSHFIEPDNDVTVFFLDIFPRLRSGVIVQIHDIFLPHDYTQRWELNDEQYLLGLLLLLRPLPIKVLAANFYISLDDDLRPRVEEIFRSPTGGKDIPFCTFGISDLPGTSFWFQIL